MRLLVTTLLLVGRSANAMKGREIPAPRNNVVSCCPGGKLNESPSSSATPLPRRRQQESGNPTARSGVRSISAGVALRPKNMPDEMVHHLMHTIQDTMKMEHQIITCKNEVQKLTHDVGKVKYKFTRAGASFKKVITKLSKNQDVIGSCLEPDGEVAQAIANQVIKNLKNDSRLTDKYKQWRGWLWGGLGFALNMGANQAWGNYIQELVFDCTHVACHALATEAGKMHAGYLIALSSAITVCVADILLSKNLGLKAFVSRFSAQPDNGPPKVEEPAKRLLSLKKLHSESQDTFFTFNTTGSVPPANATADGDRELPEIVIQK